MKMFICLSLLFVFIFINPMSASKTNNKTCPGCEDYENMCIPGFAAGDWIEGYGILDGKYYYCTVEYNDGVRGRLFKGGDSGQLFVEASNGTNYYYLNAQAAIRALYIYKKCGKHSSKYRL